MFYVNYCNDVYVTCEIIVCSKLKVYERTDEVHESEVWNN